MKPGRRISGRILRMLLPVLIIAAGIALTTVMILSRPQPPASPATVQSIPVDTMVVRSTDSAFTIASQGTVEPRTQTRLVAEVAGRVASVAAGFVAGGFFHQDDYEVAVDQARAALISAEARLAEQQAQAEQAARQWDLTGRPREEAPPLLLRTPFLREAEAQVLQAESELQRAQRQLERTTVRAPYDALVREKNADIGQYLNTGTEIARLFATDHAEVRLPLSADDLAWLDLPEPGAGAASPRPVTLRAELAGKTRKWHARVVRTEGVIDSSSRMLYAVARIDDPYARNPEHSGRAVLRAGTFVTAALPAISSGPVFALPHHVLYNGNHVLVMDAEQRLRIRPVNILRADTQYTWVDGGLRDGDLVITSPIQSAIDGMRVTPSQPPS